MKGINSYTCNNNDKSNIILNANESYVGIDKDVLVRIKSSLDKIEFNRYPEDASERLRKSYSKYADVKSQNIIAGHGSDEMLGLVIGSTISKGKKLLTLSPDFSMYDYYTSMNGGEVVKFDTDLDGSFKVEDFIQLGKKENVDLIIFSNPNNPTGYALKNNEIIKILEEFKDIYVVVDEAYYEFYGETIIKYINSYNNLLVTRTLSKAWGLAALRVGFLIGNEEVIKKINKFKVPYNVNSLSQDIAATIIEDKSKLNDNVSQILLGREFLYSELINIENEAALKVEFYESKANFIYGRTKYKEALFNRLNVEGIVIRNFNDDTFRITIGSLYENKKIIECLREVFVYGGRDKWQTEVLA